VKVEDTGIGMSKRELGHAFEVTNSEHQSLAIRSNIAYNTQLPNQLSRQPS
jgi:hypothetical protein